MRFKKGESGNPNGRPKGTTNRTTSEIKQLLTEFISENLDDLQKHYNELEAKEKLQFFERLIKYVLPQQQSYTENIDVSQLSGKQIDELIDRVIKKQENEI